MYWIIKSTYIKILNKRITKLLNPNECTQKSWTKTNVRKELLMKVPNHLKNMRKIIWMHIEKLNKWISQLLIPNINELEYALLLDVHMPMHYWITETMCNWIQAFKWVLLENDSSKIWEITLMCLILNNWFSDYRKSIIQY